MSEVMPKSFRLPKKSIEDLERLAEFWGCKQTDVIIRCLHEYALLETERMELEEQRRIVEAQANEIHSIHASLQEIKAMVSNPQYVPMTNTAQSDGIQSIPGAKPLAMPVFEDGDTVVIHRDTTSGETASNNFHNSMMSLMEAMSNVDLESVPDNARQLKL